MTREELLNGLHLVKNWKCNGDSDVHEIISEAIEALEAQADGDTISRQAAVEAFKPYADYESNRTNADWVRRIELVLHDLPSAQPETHEKRTETHACDLISRQAAVEALRTCYDTETVTMDNGDEYINYGDAIGEIEQLPSAQPEVLACGEGELIAQPEIVRCKDCKYWNDEFAKDKSTCWLPCMSMTTHREWHCGSAERRTDGIR